MPFLSGDVGAHRPALWYFAPQLRLNDDGDGARHRPHR
jgi:hypothetical protein